MSSIREKIQTLLWVCYHGLSGTNTDFFYNQIASPFVENSESQISVSYFDIRDFETIIKNNDQASLIENDITILKSEDCLNQLPKRSDFGKDIEEQLFTSFFICLLNDEDTLHENARGYFKYFLDNDIVMKISTISIAEYCVLESLLPRAIIPNDSKLFAQADLT